MFKGFHVVEDYCDSSWFQNPEACTTRETDLTRLVERTRDRKDTEWLKSQNLQNRVFWSRFSRRDKGDQTQRRRTTECGAHEMTYDINWLMSQ